MLVIALRWRYIIVSEGMIYVKYSSLDGGGVVHARVRACSLSHWLKLLYLFHCFSCVLVGSLCIPRQSWFEGDDLVLFFIRIFRYFGVPDGYARCRLCAVDIRVSSRRLVTFQEHVRGKKLMLRDTAFCYDPRMALLKEDGMAMTARAVEWRLRLVEGRNVTVMEFMPEFSVTQAIDIKREEGLSLG